MRNGNADIGIVGIIAGFLIVSAIITEVTGSFMHWPFIVAGIIVGLAAVRAINR
jgi:hypothetical protein